MAILKIKFSKVKEGQLCALSPNHFNEDYGLKFLNIRIRGEAVDISGKVMSIEESHEHPFNVIALEDGRPRNFYPDMEVYISDPPITINLPNL